MSRKPNSYTITAPVVAIVEAKNEDMVSGLGQCIAAMVAAKISNDNAKRPIRFVHGIVSTGGDWQFLRLEDSMVTIDETLYFISNLPKIMGILKHIVLSVEL